MPSTDPSPSATARCASPSCPNEPLNDDRYCQAHRDVFDRVRGSIKLDFKQGRTHRSRTRTA